MRSPFILRSKLFIMFLCALFLYAFQNGSIISLFGTLNVRVSFLRKSFRDFLFILLDSNCKCRRFGWNKFTAFILNPHLKTSRTLHKHRKNHCYTDTPNQAIYSDRHYFCSWNFLHNPLSGAEPVGMISAKIGVFLGWIWDIGNVNDKKPHS